jgi:hypothetical protein
MRKQICVLLLSSAASFCLFLDSGFVFSLYLSLISRPLSQKLAHDLLRIDPVCNICCLQRLPAVLNRIGIILASPLVRQVPFRMSHAQTFYIFYLRFQSLLVFNSTFKNAISFCIILISLSSVALTLNKNCVCLRIII